MQLSLAILTSTTLNLFLNLPVVPFYDGDDPRLKALKEFLERAAELVIELMSRLDMTLPPEMLAELRRLIALLFHHDLITFAQNLSPLWS